MYISVKNTNRTKTNVLQSKMTLYAKLLWLQRNVTPSEYFPFLFTLILAPEDWKQNYRPLWGDPILTVFLGPILLNQQMWIIGMTLTSTRTCSFLVASRAFGDLLNISEKSCASLISRCALVLFAPNWIWRASFTPCSCWARRGTARQRQQGTTHSSWLCLLASFHVDTNAWRSPAGGDLAAESVGLGATWGKPHGTLQAIRHFSKRCWSPKLTWHHSLPVLSFWHIYFFPVPCYNNIMWDWIIHQAFVPMFSWNKCII